MSIRRDSLLHMETSALIVVVLALVLPLWLAALVALAAGIGKELWDKEHGGVPSWSDVAWDCIGTALGVLLTII